MFNKTYIVSVYRGSKYLFTDSFNSHTELKNYLRKNCQLKFTNTDLSNIKDGCIYLTNKEQNMRYEIEEGLSEINGYIVFEGWRYLPIRQYAELTGKTYRQVCYAYQHHRLQGLTIGKRGYMYIRWQRNE